jgi:hypothetical protein
LGWLAIIGGAQRGFKINSINPSVYNEREILIFNPTIIRMLWGWSKVEEEKKKESQEEEKVKNLENVFMTFNKTTRNFYYSSCNHSTRAMNG